MILFENICGFMTPRLLGFYASLNTQHKHEVKWNVIGKKKILSRPFPKNGFSPLSESTHTFLLAHICHWLVTAIIIIFAWVTFGLAHGIILWKLESLQSLSQWQQHNLTSNALCTLEDREAFNLTEHRLWLELKWGSFGLAKWEINQASRGWIPSVVLPALPGCTAWLHWLHHDPRLL